MATREFTITELAKLCVPPDDPTELDYYEHVLADEQVAVLKYTAQRRCVFRAPDDGRTYAVTYEAPLDTGDYEMGDGGPEDHGWYGGPVTADEVREQEFVVTRWIPVD
ncbi:hypothetical protein [Streptomyces sp. NPDC059597]|uniref:hypothetical protein n=1 Tax=Streptomyces sp. NPDC059597 TaxID=3346879 RepID=UPI0036A6460A